MEEATNQAELFMDPLFLDLHSLKLTSPPKNVGFQGAISVSRRVNQEYGKFRNGRHPMETQRVSNPPDG